MTRSTLRRLLFGAALSCAAAAILGMLALSYYQSRRSSLELMEAGVTAWAASMDGILTTARRLLVQATKDVQGKPVDEAQEILRQLVFDYPAFREAGLIKDGHLVCTSYNIYEPPVPVSVPEHKIIPPDGQLHITPPLDTLMGGPSLMIIYRRNENSVINLLVAPSTITSPLLYVGSMDYACFLIRKDGEVLVYPESGETTVPFSDLLTKSGRPATKSGLIYSRKIGDYGLDAVAIMPATIVMKRWLNHMPLYGMLGIIAATLFLLAARFLEDRLNRSDRELLDAIKGRQIVPFFQPVVNLTSRKCCGAEALVRWNHPDKGIIPPALFIPEAERCGLISMLTFALIEEVVNELADLLKERPDLHINLNVSSYSLDDPSFFPQCLTLLGKKVSLKQICFEITESASMNAAVVEQFAELKKSGIRLAVDDFGTGYSNLRYLMDYPFDAMKIDKAFVDGINPDGKTSGLVDHIIKIGKDCGLSLIAEGIEYEWQADYLENAGTQYGQGYYFGRPMPAKEFVSWLKREVV